MSLQGLEHMIFTVSFMPLHHREYVDPFTTGCESIYCTFLKFPRFVSRFALQSVRSGRNFYLQMIKRYLQRLSKTVTLRSGITSVKKITKTRTKIPNKMKYYAVRNGRTNGVYTSWSECESQVKGHSKSEYKSFTTKAAADAYMNGTSSSSGRITPGRITTGNLSSKRIRSAIAPYPVRCSSTLKSSENTVNIYTDGASKNNQGNKQGLSRAGYGVYYGENDDRNYSGRVSGEQTNQRGELEGIRHALLSSAKEVKNGSSKTYHIHTDSQYSKEAITNWANNWERNGWKTSAGAMVANQDLIKDCRNLYKEIKASGADIEIIKVKGHSGNHGNVMADKLAVDGCSK